MAGEFEAMPSNPTQAVGPAGAPKLGERSGLLLRLEPIGLLSELIEVPLTRLGADSQPGAMLDVAPGAVHQVRKYAFTLLVPEGDAPEPAAVELVVNGRSIALQRRGAMCSQVLKGNRLYRGYEFATAEPDARPFALICGYARMVLSVSDCWGNDLGSFYSKDVACWQDDAVDMRNAEAMMDALMADPDEDAALGWMLGDSVGAHPGAYSLIEGGFSRRAKRSVPTYLAIVEAGLDAMEAALPLVRSHAASRVQRVESVVPASQVRRAGSQEMQWLAFHLDELRPVEGARGIRVADGCSYMPANMLSVKAKSSFDVYENQLCLSYLEAVAVSLTDFESKIRRNRDAVNPYGATDGSHSGEAFNLAVAVSHILQGRGRAQFEKAERLRIRAVRLMGLYRRLLPGVTVRPLAKMQVMRTKIFKEIRAYSQMFVHIERFCRYGESVPGTDGLAIASLRLDRAYETYVLYRMLSWLSARGFRPVDGSSGVYTGAYGYRSAVYFDDPHVCNVYRLKSGDAEVDLYYEPVVFFDGERRHGMPLCRISGGKQRVFTPDYVLVVRRPDDGRKVFVLDAKYRSRRNTLCSFGEGNLSAYEDCVSKYLMRTVDGDTLRLPDALWLLCGIEDGGDQVIEVGAAPWRADFERETPSGVMLVTPNHSLDPLFARMGLVQPSSSESVSRFKGSEEAQHAFRFGAPARSAPVYAPELELELEPEPEPESKPEPGLEPEPAVASACASEPEPESSQGADGEDGVRQDADGDLPVKPHGKSARVRNAEEERRRQREAARRKERKREEKLKRRKAERAEAAVKAEAEKKDASSGNAIAANAAAPVKRATDDRESIEGLVLRIIDRLGEQGVPDLYDATKCRRVIGLSMPLLRNKQAKGYVPVTGRDGVFFKYPMLPNHRHMLERHLERLEGEK